jgi:hypothetical protein
VRRVPGAQAVDLRPAAQHLGQHVMAMTAVRANVHKEIAAAGTRDALRRQTPRRLIRLTGTFHSETWNPRMTDRCSPDLEAPTTVVTRDTTLEQSPTLDVSVVL